MDSISQKRFVKTEIFLDLISKKNNFALLGLKKTGKTLLLKKLIEEKKDSIPAYIDLNKLSLTPEIFAIEFIGNVLYWHQKKDIGYKNYLNLDFLLRDSSLPSKCVERLKLIENELQKIKPNQRFLIEQSFGFLEDLAKDSGKQFFVAIDNFEQILQLNNFSQIKDILSLINFKSSMQFGIATSSIKLFEEIAGFEVVKLKNLTEKESFSLIEFFLGKKEKKIVDEIFSLSLGNPFLIETICTRFKKIKDVKKSFLIELSYTGSKTYSHFTDVLNSHLNKARGQSLLKAILKVLSSIKDPTLTNISKKIYRSAPVTKSLLQRLIEVDLIFKHDNKYSFADSVFSQWLQLHFNNLDFDQIPDNQTLKKIEEMLNG